MYLNGMRFDGFLAFVAILLIIACIVVPIVLYVMYVGDKPKRSTKAGKFFNFDKFYLEGILKFFYIFVCVAISAGCLLGIIAGFFVGNAFASLISLLIGIVFFFVLQFLNRMGYEFVLLFVSLVSDTKAIRLKLAPGGNSLNMATPGAPIAPTPVGAPTPYPSPQQSSPQAGTAAAPYTVQNTTVGSPATPGGAAPVAASWSCSCGHTGNTGRFCARCGSQQQ